MDEKDILRPDPALSSKTLTRSRSTWLGLLSSAQSETNLPPSCANIKALLNKTPSIPRSTDVPDFTESNSIFLEGHSNWAVSPSDTCELPLIKKSLPRKVCIGESRPAICNLSEDCMSEWTGFQPLPEPSSNYLAVFVLGWSYILSARLVEIRQKSTRDRVVYTDIKASWDVHEDQVTQNFDLDIESDNPAEVRWWAAVLAGGRGWQGILARNGEEYYPPWECHLNSSHFRIRHHAKEILSTIPAIESPSSVEALEYLCNLARICDAFDQLVAAFAAAITLPMHNRFGSPITLPEPTRRRCPRQNTELVFSDRVPTVAELPHYMALSCTSGLIASCLLGTFWEPGIVCNLASQWINPPLREIFPPLVQSKQFRPIICAMARRRPNVASLWLGAGITGLLPRIFQVSRSCMPTIFLEAVTWTASPQSFMDASNHRRVPVRRMNGRDMISREDEFRLLFLTDTESQTYGNPPLCPYPPIDLVDVQDSSLAVRLHLHCNHTLNYHSWDWQDQNGQVLRDFGMTNRSEASKTSPETKALLQSIWTIVGITCASLYKPSSGIHIRSLWNHCGLVLSGGLASICLLPSSTRRAVCTRLLTVYTSLRGEMSLAANSTARSRSAQHYEEEGFDDSLSELATRNLLSWTFFNEGTRSGERALWKHDWLEILVRAGKNFGQTDSSSSESENEVNIQKTEYIQKWQEDVFIPVDSEAHWPLQ